MNNQHSGGYAIIPARAFDDTAMTFKLITLLGIIGTYSNRDGYSWPSRATIAKRMDIGKTTVSNHLTRLKELGYLEITPMAAKNGAQTVNMYRIVMYATLPPERDRLKISGYEDIPDVTPLQKTGGLSPESTGGLSPESTGGVESRVNPERPILTSHQNNPRNDTRARANENGASGLSFQNEKNHERRPERPRTIAAPLDTPHAPATNARTAETPAPLPPAPSVEALPPRHMRFYDWLERAGYRKVPGQGMKAIEHLVFEDAQYHRMKYAEVYAAYEAAQRQGVAI